MDEEHGLGIAYPHSPRNHCFAQQSVHLTSLLSCCQASGHSRTGGCFCFPILLVILKKKGNVICKLVDRSCFVHACDGFRSSTSVQPSLYQVLHPHSPFLHLHWIETPVGYGPGHRLLPVVLLVATRGVRAASLDQTPHLHMDKTKQAESHPWIFHVASDWLGIDRYGIGGLSLALSVSAGSPRDLGWLAWCCAILPSMIWKWI